MKDIPTKELEFLDRMSRAGRITRRDFLSRMSALSAAGVVLPATLLSEAARAATPKKGGRLRMGLVDATSTDNFDPTKTTSNVEIITTQQLRNPKLAHGPVAANALMDGLRLPERWWFA